MGSLLAKLSGSKPSLKIPIQDEIPPDNDNEADDAGDEDEILNEDEIEEIEDEDIEGNLLDESKDAEEELDEELSDEGGSETNNNSGASSNDGGNKTPKEILENALEEKMKEYRVFITPELFLAMIDGIMPRFIFFVVKKTKMTKKEKWEDIQLTEKQIELLVPIAEAVIDEIFKSLTPMQQFALALGSQYAQNF